MLSSSSQLEFGLSAAGVGGLEGAEGPLQARPAAFWTVKWRLVTSMCNFLKLFIK